MSGIATSPLPLAGGAGGGPELIAANGDTPSPNPSRKREGNYEMSAEWLDIGPVDQLPALGARTLPVQGGEEIAIFRTANGQVYALINKCPHKQGPLSQGIVHDTTVTCPLHNWRISLLTGEALGDDKGCVPVIPVKIDGGRILIGRKEALQGMA
jgi:nitrite reductase (NADH) small subunit